MRFLGGERVAARLGDPACFLVQPKRVEPNRARHGLAGVKPLSTAISRSAWRAGTR